MNTEFPYTVGQRVKTYDPDDEKLVRGVVTDINKEDQIIWVKWEDLTDTVKHEANEFAIIKPI